MSQRVRVLTTILAAAVAGLAAAQQEAARRGAEVVVKETPVQEEAARRRLEGSPRHHEWATVQSGGRAVHAYVAYPESKDRATAVLVIHENRGLNDWARGVADQLAEAGYLAVAPDLLSGMAPGGGRTSDFASSDAAREAIYKLEPDRVVADLDAVADYATRLPASNGKLAVAGFCWGGGQSFRYATRRADLAAAFVFYGAFEHTREELARIEAPVYGFYGGDDARINATIPATEAAMKGLGKTYEPVVYEGAGHGFMRSGEEPGASEADRQARAAAWERWKKILAER
jgi:carboxymethylenebutenolidase